MTLFTQCQQNLPCRRVAVLCMLLGGLLIAPAFGQTSSPTQTLYQRLGGLMASHLSLHWSSLVLRNIPSLLTCSADMGRTASSGSSNWSSS